jgi:hypothetical protein
MTWERKLGPDLAVGALGEMRRKGAIVAEGLPGLVSQSTGGQAVQELGAIDGRSRLDRDEEVDAAGHPSLPVVADRSSRNDDMQVGMRSACLAR